MSAPGRRTFYALHASSFVLHLVSGVLGILIAQDSRIDIPVFANYISYNKNNPNAPEIFEKKVPQLVFRLNPLQVLCGVEFVTAAWQLVYVYEIYSSSSLDRWSARPLRWLEYGVTATLITLANLISTGGNDVMLFVIVLGASVALQACGLLAEIAWQPRATWNTLDREKLWSLCVAQVQGHLLLGVIIGAIVAQSVSNNNGDRAWKEQTAVYSIYLQKDEAVRSFKEDKDVNVLFASVQCGGTGLNLQEASAAVIVDLWWNPFVTEQAVRRIWRLGQANPCDVVFVQYANSFDDAVMDLYHSWKLENARALLSCEHTADVVQLGAREAVTLVEHVAQKRGLEDLARRAKELSSRVRSNKEKKRRKGGEAAIVAALSAPKKRQKKRRAE